jgi:hypothetical protein
VIRVFPYPFGSALTVVSDVDGASKARYEGYVGDMVRKLGLDFGDSTWLKTSSEGSAGAVAIANGLGFFSRHFGIGNSEVAQTFTRTRTFLESLAEYHAGNLDHFHAFVNRGPRAVILERGEPSPEGLQFELAGFETEGFWRCGGIYIDAVCVVARGASEAAAVRVVVAQRDGQVVEFDRQVAAPQTETGDRQTMFVVTGAAEDDRQIPRLDEIARVSVVVQGDASQILRVVLVSASTSIVLDRLRLLRDRFNVEIPLVTEHSGLHFRSAVMAARRDGEQDAYLASHSGLVAALNGAHRTPEQGLAFSTDADDPASLARVLPELSDEFEVRFLVPQAATSNTGWTVERMVVPLATRAGTIVYQVHRMLPNLNEPANKAAFDGTFSRQENFAPRLDKVLDASEAKPGLYWPIYTHLGGITLPIADHALPSPYFEGDALRRLQDRVYNVTGSVAADARVWMARSSVFYDYALILRSIAEHVARIDANTVEISSWHDPVLNKTLPRSPAQLYGLTFYVDDPARARVLLDGRPIRLLARNGRDETGRFSVTICEAEIRHLVFDALDPLQKAGLEAQVSGGNWRFTRAEKDTPAFGRLTVSRGQSANLRIPMHGWCAVGSQLLSLVGRHSKNGSMGLTLETVAGGRLFFGDRALLEIIEPVTAHYVFEHDKSTGLRTMVAPFHCLTWAEGAATGGAMPSHPLTAITLHCAGSRGAYADFGALTLLRPRATSLNHGDSPSYCLGGVVPEFKPPQTVYAQVKGKAGAVSASVDQRGWFCFTNLPEGIYNVWTEGETGKVYDRRGPLVELRGDVMNLELSRKTSDRSSA